MVPELKGNNYDIAVTKGITAVYDYLIIPEVREKLDDLYYNTSESASFGNLYAVF
jgi:hypothetical protein